MISGFVCVPVRAHTHTCADRLEVHYTGGILPDSPSCPHFNREGSSEPKYFFPVTEPIPLPPQQGLWAEPERGREEGKKREKPRFLRLGGEERKGRKRTSSDTESYRERERKSARGEGETDLETQGRGARPPSSWAIDRPALL